jgi:hypothetical protein
MMTAAGQVIPQSHAKAQEQAQSPAHSQAQSLAIRPDMGHLSRPASLAEGFSLPQNADDSQHASAE